MGFPDCLTVCSAVEKTTRLSSPKFCIKHINWPFLKVFKTNPLLVKKLKTTVILVFFIKTTTFTIFIKFFSNNRSVMLLNALGRTRVTLKESFRNSP